VDLQVCARYPEMMSAMITCGGLVVKAHRLVYHSTLGLRVIKKKEKERRVGMRRVDGVVLRKNKWERKKC